MNVEELSEYYLSPSDVEEKIPLGKFARRYETGFGCNRSGVDLRGDERHYHANFCLLLNNPI